MFDQLACLGSLYFILGVPALFHCLIVQGDDLNPFMAQRFPWSNLAFGLFFAILAWLGWPWYWISHIVFQRSK